MSSVITIDDGPSFAVSHDGTLADDDLQIGSGKIIHANNYRFTEKGITVVGNNNTISGKYTIVYGDNNTVTGDRCRVYGDNNKVSGAFASVEGNNNTLTGICGNVHGQNNQATGFSSHEEIENVKKRAPPPRTEQIREPLRKRRAIGQIGCTNVIGPVTGRGPLMITCDGDMNAGTLEAILRHHNQKPESDSDSDSSDEEEDKRKKPEQEEQDIPGILLTEIGQDEKAKEGMECVVCLENKKQLMPMECGHLCLCFKCAKSMIDNDALNIKCPLCKIDVKKTMKRVYS
jgi:hypothetical protein